MRVFERSRLFTWVFSFMNTAADEVSEPVPLVVGTNTEIASLPSSGRAKGLRLSSKVMSGFS